MPHHRRRSSPVSSLQRGLRLLSLLLVSGLQLMVDHMDVTAPSRGGADGGGRSEAARGDVEMVDLGPSRGRRGRGEEASGRAAQSDSRRGEGWRDGRCKSVSVHAYGCALKGLEVQELEGLSSTSIYAGQFMLTISGVNSLACRDGSPSSRCYCRDRNVRAGSARVLAVSGFRV